jgi:hypothetical protein
MEMEASDQDWSGMCVTDRVENETGVDESRRQVSKADVCDSTAEMLVCACTTNSAFKYVSFHN